jgi:hypothetical protein
MGFFHVDGRCYAISLIMPQCVSLLARQGVVEPKQVRTKEGHSI